ncbi:MAG: hypothetical protein NTZ33_13340 [Bacteroidetes bacterium]|nr:hypothetical protein [Bacteroidota bacterium]
MEKWFDAGLITMYVLLTIAVISLLFFLFKFLFFSFRKSKTTVIGIIAIVALFIISFFLSSSTDIGLTLFEKTSTNPDFSRIIGSGLIFAYLMILIVAISLIYTMIQQRFK